MSRLYCPVNQEDVSRPPRREKEALSVFPLGEPDSGLDPRKGPCPLRATKGAHVEPLSRAMKSAAVSGSPCMTRSSACMRLCAMASKRGDVFLGGRLYRP